MTKIEFLTQLQSDLRKYKVPDEDDILEEYRQHFDFKTSDGYTEEEICAKLGAPGDIAAQYSLENSKPAGSGFAKAVTVTGLVFLDIFVVCFFIILGAWIICMAAIVISIFACGIMLLLGYNSSFAIPYIPFLSSVFFSLVLLAFSAISVVGFFYFIKLFDQLKKSYLRFHRNVVATASGSPRLPSVTVFPSFPRKTVRVFKRICLSATIIFVVFAAAGYIASATSAGSLEFWHVWRWFL